jgi:hypothetical protein
VDAFLRGGDFAAISSIPFNSSGFGIGSNVSFFLFFKEKLKISVESSPSMFLMEVISLRKIIV